MTIFETKFFPAMKSDSLDCKSILTVKKQLAKEIVVSSNTPKNQGCKMGQIYMIIEELFFSFNRYYLLLSFQLPQLWIWRLCQSSIQYAMLVELADKLYNP